MYPLVGSGVILFLPCRRSSADSCGKTLVFLFPLALLRVYYRKTGEVFSPPHFFCLRTKETGWHPKKIHQRGASITFGLLALTAEHSFAKTLPFSFRCRCAGADSQVLRSIVLPHPQANLRRRRRPLARKSITITIGAAAINRGNKYPVIPRRSIGRCNCSMRSRKKQGSWGENAMSENASFAFEVESAFSP